MRENKYPDGSKEPDTEYNDFVNHITKAKVNDIIVFDESQNDNSNDLDNVILNSSALAKNNGKDNKYSYMPNNISNTTAAVKSKHLPFKEQWKQVDETCISCGAVTKQAKGITQQNINRLLSFKGNTQGWVMFFLLCVALFFAYTSYSFLTTPINCTNASTLISQQQSPQINYLNQMPIINISNLPITNNSYCQYTNPDISTFCQNLSFESNESI